MRFMAASPPPAHCRRRSADVRAAPRLAADLPAAAATTASPSRHTDPPASGAGRSGPCSPAPAHDGRRYATHRSEEHTSELQSLMRISYAVFCLKKKTNIHQLHGAHLCNTLTNPPNKYTTHLT